MSRAGGGCSGTESGLRYRATGRRSESLEIGEIHGGRRVFFEGGEIKVQIYGKQRRIRRDGLQKCGVCQPEASEFSAVRGGCTCNDDFLAFLNDESKPV